MASFLKTLRTRHRKDPRDAVEFPEQSSGRQEKTDAESDEPTLVAAHAVACICETDREQATEEEDAAPAQPDQVKVIPDGIRIRTFREGVSEREFKRVSDRTPPAATPRRASDEVVARRVRPTSYRIPRAAQRRSHDGACT